MADDPRSRGAKRTTHGQLGATLGALREWPLLGQLVPAAVDWLNDPAAIKPAIAIVVFWRYVGFNVVLYLAALQTIPADLYEAARMDGAGRWQRFVHITLPLLKPVIAIQALFQVIDNVYSYNIVSMMFGQGAGHPGEWADLLMPLLTRQSFSYWLFGQGAAVSFVLMALMLTFVAVWMRTFRRSLVSLRECMT